MDLLSRIAGWLSDHKARISTVVGIAVTAPASTVTYKGKALDVIEVSQELRARCIYCLRQFGLTE
jgi:TolB-like protein